MVVKSLARNKHIAFGSSPNKDMTPSGPTITTPPWATLSEPWRPHAGQRRAVKYLLEHACAGLFASPGTGKTSAVLAAFKVLLAKGVASKMLVIAPLRPCTLVWPKEIEKWLDFKGLKFAVLHGKDKEKALTSGASIMIINYEGLPWLLGATSEPGFGGKRKGVSVNAKKFVSYGFDTLVMDECFVAGTPVLTPEGDRPIEEIRAGDMVMTHLGPRRVIRTMQRSTTHLVEMRLSNGRTVKTTRSHPVFVGTGWLSAESCSHRRCYGFAEVRQLWGHISAQNMSGYLVNQTPWYSPLMFSKLWSNRSMPKKPKSTEGRTGQTSTNEEFPTYAESDSRDYKCGLHSRHSGYVEVRRMRKAFPMESCGCHKELPRKSWQRAGLLSGVFVHEDAPTKSKLSIKCWRNLIQLPAREREQKCSVRGVTTEDSAGGFSTWLCDYSWRSWASASTLLCVRFREPTYKNRNRSRWPEPSSARTEITGRGESREIDETWVDSITHIELDRGENVWNLEVEDAETYFAHGIFVHNCSRLKHTNTTTFKTLKPVLHTFARRWGLTGSPASNGLENLFGQMLAIDGGRSLGQYVTHYRSEFFHPHPSGFGWVLNQGADVLIHKRIAPVILRLDAADYVSIPELIENRIEFELPKNVREIYDQVEDDLFAKLEAGEVVAANAAAASSKCRQIVNGGVYLEDEGERKWQNLHMEKVELVADLVSELQGEPLLVAYDFAHDRDRLMIRFGKDIPYIGGGVSPRRAEEIIEAWNRGEIPILLGNAQSMGHGINAQGSCFNVCWHSLTWDLELFTQFIGRVFRQGQKAKRVFVHAIMAKRSIDEAIWYALHHKEKGQNALFEALKGRRR